jgi:hypothetical protein
MKLVSSSTQECESNPKGHSFEWPFGLLLNLSNLARFENETDGEAST